MTGRTCIIFAVPQDIAESDNSVMRDLTRKNLSSLTYSSLAVVHRLLGFSSITVLLLPPEFLSVAVLIFRLYPCHLLHIAITVRSLKTKTFEILDSPNKLGSFIIGDTSSSRSDLFISFGFY